MNEFNLSGIPSPKEPDTLASNLLAWALLASFVPPLMLWGAWVDTVLWGWWIVPTFGLKALTIAKAIGISTALGALLGIPRLRRPVPEKDVDYPFLSKVTDLICAGLMFPACALATGYIARFITL